jgi:hypothetical protein
MSGSGGKCAWGWEGEFEGEGVVKGVRVRVEFEEENGMVTW